MKRTRITMKSTSEMTLKQVHEQHYNEMKSLGCSLATLENYKNNYSILSKFFKVNYSIVDIDTQVIVELTNFLRDNFSNNSTTINVRLKYLKVLLNYANDKGYCDIVKVKLVTTTTKKKLPLTNEEVGKLLAKPTTNRFGEYRSWMICNLILATGVRSRNVREARVEDLDLSRGILTLHDTKAHREQIVYLPSSMVKLLREYLSLTQLEGWLFPNEFGEQLSYPALKVSFRNYVLSRGVDTSPHVLRHTFCKNCIVEQNLNPFIVQQLMGHSNIQTTQRYVNMFNGDVENAISGIDMLAQYNKTKIKVGRR